MVLLPPKIYLEHYIFSFAISDPKNTICHKQLLKNSTEEGTPINIGLNMINNSVYVPQLHCHKKQPSQSNTLLSLDREICIPYTGTSKWRWRSRLHFSPVVRRTGLCKRVKLENNDFVINYKLQYQCLFYEA